MAGARDRLAAARAAFDADFFSNSASSAYYAMLFAARAALSEDERHAKTHSGTWALFRQTFVMSGRFDRDLFAGAHRAQQQREAADYDAAMLSQDEAAWIVALADRFVTAVGDMLEA